MARWWTGQRVTGAALLTGLLLLGSAPTSRAAATSSGAAESAAAAPSSPRQKQLAGHLKQVGAVFYGAWWCPHCNTQKELFGLEAIELLPYVECDKDEPGRKRCMEAKVRAYPTWVLKGDRREGVMSLDELESWSGFRSAAKR
jgi:glutaredoxin